MAGLGVQVLFGFLLSLPFGVRFEKLDHSQRLVYLAALLLAALATALLCAPVAYHRFIFRRHQKGTLLVVANTMALLGPAAVGLAISAAVLLVGSFVERGLPVVLMVAFTVLCLAGLWFAFPLVHRRV